MKKVKYGMIGFGGIAENRIAKEGFACDKSRFAELPNAVLLAATDVNPGRRKAAEALGLKWYDSCDAMLADPELDAIYVATNNATHAKLCLAALKAGKHVIVEKPMATSIADARKMIDTAKKLKLSLAVDHMMVHNAYNIKARKLVADGALGKVNDACFHMEFAYGYDPAEAATWRCSNVREMGGPIGDVASHCFYMAEFIFDSTVEWVAAVYLPKLMDIKAEDGAYIKFGMANGITASAKVAFSEPRGGLVGTLTNLGYEIYGDGAVLRGFGTMFQLSGYPDEPIKIRLEVDSKAGQKKVAPGKIQNIYQALITGHAKSVLSKRPLCGCDAMRNLELCEATHRSARHHGRKVSIVK